MKINYVEKKVALKKGENAIICCFENNRISTEIAEIMKKEGITSEQLKSLGFKGKEGETALIPSSGGKVFIFTGAGKKSEINEEKIRKAIGKGIFEALNRKLKKVAVLNFNIEKKGEDLQKALAEGILLSAYRFNKYLKEKINIEEITVYGKENLKEEFFRGQILGEAANLTRDLVNEPGNVITPQTLAETAKSLSKKYGFKCKIFTEKELEKNRMNGILTVGKGSKNPPCFIHIKYKPENPTKKVVLVGKGVTFDSGGLNLKPEQYMKRMKMDKAGACAVLGIMKAIGEIKPDIEVHALIPAVENMPDGKAYRPDDIIEYKNGVTVEIHSTDAEGRLILADALIYGSELKPDLMIDMATLTGACVVALGNYTTGLFSKDTALAHSLQKLSQKTGEKMWHLPLDEDLKEEIKGTQSDIQNVGKTRFGGAITAALFLQNFVEENVKSWIHLDIAGPAFIEKEWKYYSFGATGQPVRTITEFITKNR
ncbi:leucyl aminopeptidase [Desulfurobacterium atlanticum]|uniref:Probable cytosol aminopeptidase n=1 Tax=Desulfurobacterium atlanticum TaxID=240169 RepID=A0A238YM14_9BACT|nr:leucyl aminopeptidase [Desulfurobacterium atlanticum]SNR72080.1 leucyl aminopeptidase [Desulfurobacterium atlanticum]